LRGWTSSTPNPPKPPGGRASALVAVADMRPKHRSRHPPSANPCQLTTISGNSSRWKPRVTDPKRPDGAAAAPVADAGLPPKWTPQVTPSLARRPDEGGEGSEGTTSHKYLGSRHLRRGGNVRGTPLDLYVLFSLSPFIPLSFSFSSLPYLSPHSLPSSLQ
jgi:hypothetical protein